MNEETMILRVINLKKHFPLRTGIFKPKKYVHAVDNVSFSVRENETFGLVGESGSGKSTLARTVLRLIEPDGGKILFDNVDITKLPYKKLVKVRRRLQLVPQNPFLSLDPRMRIKDVVLEPILFHKIAKGSEARELAFNILSKVGLEEELFYRFPHELSGGQRQRVAIARALSLNPELIILDEPTSFLDVSVQARILNLLLSLQNEFRLSYFFISHDLSVVHHVSDRVAVMYAGKIVEVAQSDELFKNPLHPYTQALISAIPVPDPELKRKKRRILLGGEVPSLINPPSGCRFHPRCPYMKEQCKKEEPKMVEISVNHHVACHMYSKK